MDILRQAVLPAIVKKNNSRELTSNGRHRYAVTMCGKSSYSADDRWLGHARGEPFGTRASARN
jgi:hypothetical protein